MTALRLLLVLVAAALLAPASASADTPATPPCPQVEGWVSAGTFGPIDNGNAVEFECNYSLPGYAQQLTLDMHWYKPSARDVDVDWTQCSRASSGGAYYTDVWSGAAFVHEAYVVNAGTAEGNAAVFKAEQDHIAKAAKVLMTATEALAKRCQPTSTPVAPTPTPTPAPTAEPPADAAPPLVHVQRASGRAGKVIPFNFTIGDASGSLHVVVTITRGASRTVMMRKDYGTVSVDPAGSGFVAKIRARTRGRYRWCVKATNDAGTATTACSSLVVR
jgi:hypothetical protein